MPSISDVGTIFKTIREVDLSPIREEAERQTWIAIVGTGGSGARGLATALYLAPRTLPPDDASNIMAGPILITEQNLRLAERAELVVFVLEPGTTLSETLRAAFQKWLAADKKIIVLFNQSPTADAILARHEWFGARVLEGEVVKREFLEKNFVPAVLALLPENKLSLARSYPLFRSAVAKDVINETSMANASYSFSTGIAEIIPVLNIPFNVADMIVLTKAQAFMVYRLGLIFGLSTRWQDHLAAFGSTVGAGFLFRTAARQLVGLLPAIGIVPKVAIAYAGTYAMGRAALQWYETGRAVKRGDIDKLFQEALSRGKTFAASLAEKAPKVQPRKLLPPSLPFRKKNNKVLALPAGAPEEKN